MAARKPAARVTASKSAATTVKAAATAATQPVRRTIAARPLLQWIGAAVGTVVTVAAIVVIAQEALAPARPVVLSASVTEVRQTGAGWIAEIEVANAGSTAAAAVTVEGRMGETVATASLDYVPGDGEAEASLRFPSDPRTTPSVVVVTGWTEP